MFQNEPKVIAYYRVSSVHQRLDGHGIAAQKQAVENFAKQHGAKIIAEFTEQESGKLRAEDRKLNDAIALAKVTRATVCVSKLDRVGRNAADTLKLLNDPKIRVVFADSPHASQLENGIRAVIAEEEGKAISERTRKALAVARTHLAKQGRRLGNPNGARALKRYREANGIKRGSEAARHSPGCVAARRAADDWANDMRAFVSPLVSRGLPNAGIAAALNDSGIPTRRNKSRWFETSVRNLRGRLAI